MNCARIEITAESIQACVEIFKHTMESQEFLLSIASADVFIPLGELISSTALELVTRLNSFATGDINLTANKSSIMEELAIIRTLDLIVTDFILHGQYTKHLVVIGYCLNIYI